MFAGADRLLQAARIFHDVSNKLPHLMKADIDSAFRRIPIKPEHRSFAWICFKFNEQVVAARHLALMFGSVASVHHWERIGAPRNVREYGTSVRLL